MSRGRNTSLITIRLDDSIIEILTQKASAKNMTPGQYIKDCIIRSVITTKDTHNTPDNHSVIATKYDPSKHNLTMSLPIYDPMIHKPGDKVRIFHYGRWKATIVPDSVSDTA